MNKVSKIIKTKLNNRINSYDPLSSYRIKELLKSVLIFIKYIVPVLLVLNSILIGVSLFLSEKIITSYTRIIDSVNCSNLIKSDFIFLTDITLNNMLFTLLTAESLILIAALLSILFYKVCQIASSYLLYKYNKNNHNYYTAYKNFLKELNSNKRFVLAKKGFILIILSIAVIFIININTKQNPINNSLYFFRNYLFFVICIVYPFMWVLYKHVYYSKDKEKFLYIFYSKPARIQRFINFTNAFLTMFVISKVFITAIYFMSYFENIRLQAIYNSVQYERFWSEIDLYNIDDISSKIELPEKDKIADKILMSSDFIKNQDLSKIFIETMYNLIIFVFLFEILFPYIALVFTKEKNIWDKLKKLFVLIAKPAIITIVYQILSEGIFFGFNFTDFFTFRNLSLFLFSTFYTLKDYDNIFEFNEDKSPCIQKMTQTDCN